MEILHTIGLHVDMPWLVGGINCGLGSGASCTYRGTLMAVVEPSWLKKESRLLAAFPTTDLLTRTSTPPSPPQSIPNGAAPASTLLHNRATTHTFQEIETSLVLFPDMQIKSRLPGRWPLD
jgi:hypothetical protein